MTFDEFNSRLLPLLRQINDHTNALLRPLCDQRGLTPAQLRALLALHQAPCAVGELGRCISMADANVSALCKRLQRQGLVTRARAPQDERVVHLALTPDGERLALLLESQLAQRLQPVWEARRQELSRILRDLSTLSDQLENAVQLAINAPIPQEKEPTI